MTSISQKPRCKGAWKCCGFASQALQCRKTSLFLKSRLSTKLSWKPRTILFVLERLQRQWKPSASCALWRGSECLVALQGHTPPFSLPNNTQVSIYPCLSHSQFSGNALALENHSKHGHWINQCVLSFQPQKWPKDRRDNKIRRLTMSLENLAVPAHVKPSRSCCEIPDFILLS